MLNKGHYEASSFSSVGSFICTKCGRARIEECHLQRVLIELPEYQEMGKYTSPDLCT